MSPTNAMGPAIAVAPPASRVSAMTARTRVRTSRTPWATASSSPRAMALSGPDTAKARTSATAKNGRIGHTTSSGRPTIEPAFQDRIASKASGLVSWSASLAPPSTAPTQTPASTMTTGD